MDPENTVTTAGVAQRHLLEQTINSFIIMLPYLLLGVITLIYSIVVAVLRLIHRGSLRDQVDVNRPGRWMLILASVLCGLVVAHYAYEMIATINAGARVRFVNRTMLRVSEYIGWGMRAYEVVGILLYGTMGILCLTGIHHGQERLRLARMSILVLLINIL